MTELTKIIQETAKEYDVRKFFKDVYSSVIKAFKSLNDDEKNVLFGGNKGLTTLLYFSSSEDGFISVSSDYDTIKTEIKFDTKGFCIIIALRPTPKPFIQFYAGEFYTRDPYFAFPEMFTDRDLLDDIFGEYLDPSSICDRKEHYCNLDFMVYEKWFLN